jgi:hypothetical protein
VIPGLHGCAALKCTRSIVLDELLCHRHWAMLSDALKTQVIEAQRNRLTHAGRQDYVEVCNAVVVYLTTRERIWISDATA